MLQALIGPVTGLLDKFIEDKDQKNKASSRNCNNGREKFSSFDDAIVRNFKS